MVLDKFIVPFMDFIKKHFDISEHKFVFLHGPLYEYGMTPDKDVVWIDKKYKIFELLKYMYEAKKIIIHGLWSEHLVKLLFVQPWLLKKCYWAMWGGDFYFPEQQSQIKKKLIKKIKHFVTYIPGDYEYVKLNYGANGYYHECLMYPSNVIKNIEIPPKSTLTINILVGNSATETNNHIEVFEKLKIYKNENIKIYCPLSYGDKAYAKKVIAHGKEIFGEKFIPLTEFIPFEKYLEFLGDIDIAILAHNRQQAMGNTITLLGLGKKVYMRSDTTQYKLFEGLGIKVFDINKEFDVEPINEDYKKRNIELIKNFFSEERLKEQLSRLYES